jgi:hypothetical protein
MQQHGLGQHAFRRLAGRRWVRCHGGRFTHGHDRSGGRLCRCWAADSGCGSFGRQVGRNRYGGGLDAYPGGWFGRFDLRGRGQRVSQCGGITASPSRRGGRPGWDRLRAGFGGGSLRLAAQGKGGDACHRQE